jgi:hypothetical protein
MATLARARHVMHHDRQTHSPTASAALAAATELRRQNSRADGTVTVIIGATAAGKDKPK